MYEAHGAEPRVNLAEEMEKLRIGALKVDGDYRESRILDQFYDILRPGLVFDDFLVRNGGTFALLLVSGDFSRREESQRSSVVYVLQGHANAVDTLRRGSIAAEIVHGHETALQTWDQSEKECGEYAVILALSAYYGAQDQTVDAAEVMVGNSDESTFFRDAPELFGKNLVCDADFFENGFGEVGTVIRHQFLVDGVYFVDFEETKNASGYKTSEAPLEFEGVLQVGFRYYVLLFFHSYVVKLHKAQI